jgi:SAM-dependent methyltransferase
MSADLRAAVWAFSALRVAAERGVLTAIDGGARDLPSLARATGLEPAALRRLVEVLAAYGVVAAPSADDGVALTPAGAELASREASVVADLTATFGQARAFVDDARRGDLRGGWRHADPEVIRAQGRISEHMMTTMLRPMREAIPALERLARPGASFLDVGIGAAGGAIALGRAFPSLRVVGLEPLPVARLEARAAIDAAGMRDRVEVRAHGVEELREEGAFDAAFVASVFLPDAALEAGLARVHRALAPGGVALFAAWARPTDARLGAVSALRWHLWGGGLRDAGDVTRIAKAAGFTEVHRGPTDGDMVPMFSVKER